MEDKLYKILRDTNDNNIGLDTALVQVLDLFSVSTRFKCKCGCNNFAFVGGIPESTEDGFLTGKIDDILFNCTDCGDPYYLSELNGR